MWFDYAHGKENIKFMFNNELSLDESELESFLFYDLSKIRICFNTRNIPKKTPDKWKKLEFNGLSIKLTLVGIKELNLQGKRIGFTCTPEIKKPDNKIVFTVNNDEGRYLLCSAEFIVINSIEPYLDERWK
ncbi:hypothetical protein HF675_09380 [Serratia sp. JUb9]|uniref:Imm50 family immunity protein n=1 Tax=Serratia sp. JUb9 TaxID=2724469 RepID=UPI00164DC243|nr:Imm50 family immunity protein [Serratia sp. JUb9]QNK34215.1 hypothetical protein HF675_09380 [Serratia sp. JUb9]